jgi:lipid A oxidase
MERATDAPPTGRYVFRARAVSIYVARRVWRFPVRQAQRHGAGGRDKKIMSRSLRALALAVAGICFCAAPALAEMQISVYGGANWNFNSDVNLRGSAIGNDDRSMDWEGGSLGMPPYWGVRGTYWLSKSSSWGFALEYTHQKAIADLDFATDPTYSHLEFTDGNNLVMLEVLYRFSPMMNGTLVPYIGAGVGVTVPHVEVTLKTEPPDRTFEYQCCGAAAQIMAGLEYKLTNAWSLFTEAKLSYSHISGDLDGGGSLETDLWSPAVAVGLTYRFPGN